MRSQRVVSVILASALAGSVTFAQVGRGGSEWLTAFGDAQRTSWIPNEPRLSVELMSKPGFALQWTSKLDNQARGANGLAQGVSANGVTLFVPMSVVAGSSNTVYGIDNDLGYVVWKRQFEATLPSATAGCPGGITAAATRIVNLMPATIAAPAPAGGGRGAVGYRSMIGEPGEGVPVEGRGGAPGRGAAAPVAAPPGTPAAAGAEAVTTAGRGGRVGGAPQPQPPVTAPATQAGAPAAPAAGAAPQNAGRGAPGARGGGAGAPRGGGDGGGGGRGGPTGNIPGAPPEVLVGGNARPSGVAYVVSSDGMLHVVGLPSGKDIQRPAQFLPANARWSDPIAVGTMLYASTSGDCGGAPSAVWAKDLQNNATPAVSWRTNGGNVIGPVAFTTGGALIAAVGPGRATGDGKANAIVALDPQTLQVKDWFSDPALEIVTSPTIFRHNDKEIVAAATKDGRILLLDAVSLGGPDNRTPLHASRSILGGSAALAGSLATWQQATITPGVPAGGAPPVPGTVTLGTRWILAPVSGALAAGIPVTNGGTTAGSVVALKLVEGAGGALSLEPGWRSHNLTTPATPITVNGVVFALSTGRPATGPGAGTAAVLYAYDGATGKALWNSAKAMTTSASPGSFWSAMGQAYVGTRDGTVYAFGFLDERR